MARYIDEIIQPGENRLFSTTVHWIVYWQAFFALAVALLLLWAGAGMVGTGAAGLTYAASVVVAVIAGIAFIRGWWRRFTTEVDVTDRRIVLKRGFIKRQTVEINTEKVEAVDVDQSVLGRILNYGTVTIRGTGTLVEPMTMIGAPLTFRNHVTAR